jgi:hypothetical protein
MSSSDLRMSFRCTAVSWLRRELVLSSLGASRAVCVLKVLEADGGVRVPGGARITILVLGGF